MSITTIHTLLDTHLLTVTGLPTLQRENTRVTPQTGVPWSRATLLPAETRQETLGVTGRNRLNGLYQIDLFYPADTGVQDANEMADELTYEFRRGVQLVHQQSNLIVNIEMAWREAGSRYEQFYNAPVIVRWRAIE